MTKLGSQKLHFCPKETKMGSILGHRIDYNGVGGSERPAEHTQQKFTQVPPPPPLGRQVFKLTLVYTEIIKALKCNHQPSKLEKINRQSSYPSTPSYIYYSADIQTGTLGRKLSNQKAECLLKTKRFSSFFRKRTNNNLKFEGCLPRGQGSSNSFKVFKSCIVKP